MQLLLCGDTHGDLRFWRTEVIPAALRHECTTIVQLGDFGYFEHITEGVKYLNALSDLLQENLQTVYWIRGNHENHQWLRKIYAPKSGPPRFWEIRDHLYHWPDGLRVKWAGVRLLGCGGAYSIDKYDRLHRMRLGAPDKWWPEETISDEDVRRCKAAGRADVLFCHDAPWGFPVQGEHGAFKECPETEINRRRLQTVQRNSRPDMIFHGHWHQYHDTQTDEARIVGLGHNAGHTPALAVLELPTLRLTVLPKASRA